MIDFEKNCRDFDEVEELDEDAKVFVEEHGHVHKVPASAIGGGGGMFVRNYELYASSSQGYSGVFPEFETFLDKYTGGLYMYKVFISYLDINNSYPKFDSSEAIIRSSDEGEGAAGLYCIDKNHAIAFAMTVHQDGTVNIPGDNIRIRVVTNDPAFHVFD